MAQTIREMSTETLCAELDAAIARLKSERDKLRALLVRLISSIETGENIQQCIDECRDEYGCEANDGTRYSRLSCRRFGRLSLSLSDL